MNILIVGLGSVGRRHLENLRLIAPDAQAIIWRRRPLGRSDEVGDVCGWPRDSVVYSFEEAIEREPDAALITGPATFHVQTGLALARQRVHLFIEKPLSDGLDGVDELLRVCVDNKLALMIGYCFRFYRPLREMKRALVDGRIGRIMTIRAEVGGYLPDWRPGRDYRTAVSARRALGGGAVLELSHELDYVRWFLGEAAMVSARLARLSDLQSDVEDTAEILMEFANGAVGSVHMDMTQRSWTRGCRIVGSEGTLTWDGMKHEVCLYSAPTGRWSVLYPADTGAHEDMYRLELRGFLGAAKGDSHEGATGDDGRRVLQLVLAARQASDERRVIQL